MMSFMRKIVRRLSAPVIPDKDELWNALSAFPFDVPGSALPFSKRLADEHGWGEERTGRAIEEYRKFIYLAMTCPHTVTPSIIVDKVWHFHLQYTESYWIELCAKTLKRPLHHNPTMGGNEEHKRFQGLYLKTLEAYAKTFGEPPSDIWRRTVDPTAHTPGTGTAGDPVTDPVLALVA